MTHKCIYRTPEAFSDIVMSSDGEKLTGLHFECPGDTPVHMMNCKKKDLMIFKETSRWLDIYFSGKAPDFVPEYRIEGLTPFRQEVIDIMNTVEFGETLTYSDIAKKIAEKRGIERMSAQAVGGAVAWNPLCIIIPCHRVMGANGNLTGYSGGIQNKIALLAHEKHDITKFFMPKTVGCVSR